MTLREFLHDRYAPLTGIDRRTVRLYELTFHQFSRFLGREATLDDLAEVPVSRFLQHRLETRARGTAAKDRAQLRACWEMAARHNLTGGRWPLIRPIRVPERVPRAWLTDEFQRLLDSARQETGTVSQTPACDFWVALLLLCYEAGERISGVLSLRWEDVHDGGVTILAEGRKGQRRDIYRQITPECRQAIGKIKRVGALVFAWDRCPTRLWGHFSRILVRAGLPADRSSKFHRIRKTTASYAAAGGVDPQALMDHASPLTTRRYLDPRIVRRPSAADVLPRVK